MSGRPSILSKTKILDAATQILDERITFNAVARRLDISPQSIYKYFPNVAALQTEVVRHLLERFAWHKALDAGGESLRSAILAFGYGYRGWLRETRFDPQWLDRKKTSGTTSNEALDRFQKEVTDELGRRSGDWGISKEAATIAGAVLFDFLFNTQTLGPLRTTDTPTASTGPDAASPEWDLFEVGLEAIADRVSRVRSETMGSPREADQ